MGGENRSRDGGPGVRSAHDGRTPAESPDFRARATAEVLLLDDANARDRLDAVAAAATAPSDALTRADFAAVLRGVRDAFDVAIARMESPR